MSRGFYSDIAYITQREITDTSGYGGVVGKEDFIPRNIAATTVTFTGSGTFTNTAGATQAAILLVGGGAGGGPAHGAGGGAAGLILTPSTYTIPASPFPISIGGGSGGNTYSNGTDSTMTLAGGTLTAKGGGGAPEGYNGASGDGLPGGSGGGAGRNRSVGNATQPSQPGDSGTYGYGAAGGSAFNAGQQTGGGGGGGATQAGRGGGGDQRGGDGLDVTPTFGPGYGQSGYFSGGGGGGAPTGTDTGGLGGGGAGGNQANPGTNGTDNTGGGGGGGGSNFRPGASGGSGYAIVKTAAVQQQSGIWNYRAQYAAKASNNWV
jgi:hypothetical protein